MLYVPLARANYENVQNTKFVRKFVHIFARPVAKLRSNFRCAEPLKCQILHSSSSSSRIYYFDREGPTDVAVLLQGTLSALYRAKQKRSEGES